MPYTLNFLVSFY